MEAKNQIAMNQTKSAAAVGVTDRTIRNWEKRGLISGRRVGGGVKLYPIEDLRKLVGK